MPSLKQRGGPFLPPWPEIGTLNGRTRLRRIPACIEGDRYKRQSDARAESDEQRGLGTKCHFPPFNMTERKVHDYESHHISKHCILPWLEGHSRPNKERCCSAQTFSPNFASEARRASLFPSGPDRLAPAVQERPQKEVGRRLRHQPDVGVLRGQDHLITARKTISSGDANDTPEEAPIRIKGRVKNRPHSPSSKKEPFPKWLLQILFNFINISSTTRTFRNRSYQSYHPDP